MHYIVELNYLPINYDYRCITWNVLLVKLLNNIFVSLGCVLLFDANARFCEG